MRIAWTLHSNPLGHSRFCIQAPSRHHFPTRRTPVYSSRSASKQRISLMMVGTISRRRSYESNSLCCWFDPCEWRCWVPNRPYSRIKPARSRGY